MTTILRIKLLGVLSQLLLMVTTPAARQVQVPSGRSEVSSISSRRDMAATLTDAPATHVARSAVL